MPPNGPTTLSLNEATYKDFIRTIIPAAKRFIWILTADIKDLHVEYGNSKRFVPFLKVLSDRVENGVDVRLIHAKEPGPRFRADFDKHPALIHSDSFERILCPRMHMKIIIVDAAHAYIGSANLTGAGLGGKSPLRRNFEAGILTQDPAMITELMDWIDQFYLGDHCPNCQRRDVCPDPIA